MKMSEYNNPVRLLLVDDCPAIVERLRSLLQLDGACDVCGEARDGKEAIQVAIALKPDVVIMDVGLPGVGGLEATHQIRSQLPETEVLVVSQYDHPELVRAALEAGAGGYLLKSEAGRYLLFALQLLRRGRQFLSPGLRPEFFDGSS